MSQSRVSSQNENQSHIIQYTSSQFTPFYEYTRLQLVGQSALEWTVNGGVFTIFFGQFMPPFSSESLGLIMPAGLVCVNKAVSGGIGALVSRQEPVTAYLKNKWLTHNLLSAYGFEFGKLALDMTLSMSGAAAMTAMLESPYSIPINPVYATFVTMGVGVWTTLVGNLVINQVNSRLQGDNNTNIIARLTDSMARHKAYRLLKEYQPLSAGASTTSTDFFQPHTEEQEKPEVGFTTGDKTFRFLQYFGEIASDALVATAVWDFIRLMTAEITADTETVKRVDNVSIILLPLFVLLQPVLRALLYTPSRNVHIEEVEEEKEKSPRLLDQNEHQLAEEENNFQDLVAGHLGNISQNSTSSTPSSPDSSVSMNDASDLSNPLWSPRTDGGDMDPNSPSHPSAVSAEFVQDFLLPSPTVSSSLVDPNLPMADVTQDEEVLGLSESRSSNHNDALSLNIALMIAITGGCAVGFLAYLTIRASPLANNGAQKTLSEVALDFSSMGTVSMLAMAFGLAAFIKLIAEAVLLYNNSSSLQKSGFFRCKSRSLSPVILPQDHQDLESQHQQVEHFPRRTL